MGTEASRNCGAFVLKWIRVPVTLVRRNAHAKAASELGSNTMANSSSARIAGHKSPNDACASTAPRIASSEYVTGIRRAAHCSGAGNMLIGYMIPLTKPATPEKTTSPDSRA